MGEVLKFPPRTRAPHTFAADARPEEVLSYFMVLAARDQFKYLSVQALLVDGSAMYVELGVEDYGADEDVADSDGEGDVGIDDIVGDSGTSSEGDPA